MAQALTIAREGIVDASPPPAKTPDRVPLSPAQRLRRIEYDFAQSILLSEMLDSLTVVPPPKDSPLKHVELLARDQRCNKDICHDADNGGDAGDGAGADASDCGEKICRRDMRLLRLSQPTDQDFAEELKLILGYATLRTERLPEITVQTADIVSFFTPMLPIEVQRARMVHYLIDLVMNLSTAIVQRIKLAFDAPRPDVLSDQVQPMLPMPLHASYPSGHATQAFAVAMLLTILTRKDTSQAAEISPDSQLFRMAARIAVNRTVAGVHFPSDSVAGALLGITLARWIAVRAGASKPDCRSMDFHAEDWGDGAPGGTRDFYLARLCAVLEGGNPCLTIGHPVTGPDSVLIAGVWQMAQDEWSKRWS